MSGTKCLNSGITRRSFLKTTGVLAGAAVAGTVAPGLTALATGSAASSPEEKIAITGCHYAGCFSCQTQVVVRDGKVVGNKTWPEEPRQNRPCLRGLSKFRRIYSEERVRYPMRRVGERGQNQWERISWDEAIAEISSKWKGYMDEFGGASICCFGDGGKSGGYLQSGLLIRLRNLLGWTEALPCDDFAMAKGLNKVFGPSYNTWGFPPTDFEDSVMSKAIICWSANLTVAQTQEWRIVADAMANGTKLVTVDPNYTVMAQKSDLWVRPKPGTDTVLLFSVMQHIVANGLEDAEFIKTKTVGPALVREDTGHFLRMSDLGVAPTEGPINPMTGKPTVIDPVVAWNEDANEHGALDTVASPALRGSYTVNGIKTKTSFEMLLDVINEWPPEKAAEFTEVPASSIKELAAICADVPVYHKTGYGSQSYNNGVQNGHALATLGAITGNTCKPGAATGSGWHGPTPNLQYQAPGNKYAPGIPRLALFDVMTTGKFKGKDYPIKSIIFAGTGFVGGSPDTNRIIDEIIGNAEFVVTIDVVFSDQARWADIVLPASHNYEYEDIFSAGMWTLYEEKAVEPAFESKPDGEIARLLGRALGVGEYFDKSDDDYLHEALDSESMRALGLTVEALKKNRAMRFLPEHYVASFPMPTETGRLEFYVDHPTPRVDFGQKADLDAEHLPRWFPPTEAWHENEIMKEFPLVFMSERNRNRYHSQDYDNTWLNELEPDPILRMNPVDAEARGIAEGDWIMVRNTRGHAVARARISAGIRPGTVIYPKGWQMHQFKSGCWGSLHNSQFDPVGVNNSYFDVVCEVGKWDGGES